MNRPVIRRKHYYGSNVRRHVVGDWGSGNELLSINDAAELLLAISSEKFQKVLSFEGAPHQSRRRHRPVERQSCLHWALGRQWRTIERATVESARSRPEHASAGRLPTAILSTAVSSSVDTSESAATATTGWLNNWVLQTRDGKNLSQVCAIKIAFINIYFHICIVTMLQWVSRAIKVLFFPYFSRTTTAWTIWVPPRIPTDKLRYHLVSITTLPRCIITTTN